MPFRGSEPLRRAAAVLDAVAASPDGAEVARIAEMTALPVATAYRIVKALVEVGYLQTAGRGAPYRLGDRLLLLAPATADAGAIAPRCQPILGMLAERIGATAFVTSLRGRRVHTVAQAFPTRASATMVLPVSNLPLHASASGKLFLAAMPEADLKQYLTQKLERHRPATIVDPSRLMTHLRRVRARGYATSLDEFDKGVFSIAAPIVRRNGGCSYAVGSVGLSQYLLQQFGEKRLADAVRRAARDLTPIVAATTR